MAAARAFAVDVPIVVAIPPPPDHGFNSMLLNYTVRRDLFSNSFFRDRGGSRFGEESFERKREEIEESCKVIQAGLTGPLYLRRCHWCYGILMGDRCCVDNATATTKVAKAIDAVMTHTLASLRTLAKSKWRSVSLTLSKLALALLVCDLLPDAWDKSTGTAAEIRKARDDIQRAAEAVLGDQEMGSSEAYRLLKGKSTVSCADFFKSESTLRSIVHVDRITSH